jgi:hypothetical protein
MTLRSPAGRDSRADEARQKIRKVGELIRLRQKIKTDVSDISEEAALLVSLDKAAAELMPVKAFPLNVSTANHFAKRRRRIQRNDGPHFPGSPTCHSARPELL